MIRRPPRSTLFPLHDALPICVQEREGEDLEAAASRHGRTLLRQLQPRDPGGASATAISASVTPGSPTRDRKSTRLNSSHLVISYAVFCLKKKRDPSRTVHIGG